MACRACTQRNAAKARHAAWYHNDAAVGSVRLPRCERTMLCAERHLMLTSGEVLTGSVKTEQM